MEKTIQTEDVLTAGKTAYEKPTSQVYEMEIEGAILDTSGQPKEYEYEDPLS